MGGYLYLQLDDEIRRFAQATLADHYPNLSVSVGSARYVPGRGVSLYDVQLAGTTAGNATSPKLNVSELRLVGDFDLRRLAAGTHALERIDVRRPRLESTRDAAGSWDAAAFWPPPSSGGPMAPLTITNATLVVRDASSADATATQPLTVRNIDLELLANTETTPTTPGAMAFRGAVQDSIAKSLRFEGQLSPTDHHVQANLEAEGLHVTNELLAALPGFDAAALRGLRVDLKVNGKGAVTVSSPGEQPTWSGDLEVVGGSVDHPMLPRPVSDLAVSANVAHDRLQVDKLSAHIGGAELSAAGNRRGWSADSPGAVTWRLTGLSIDEKLYYSLPKVVQSMWNRFRPTGLIDATGSATFDGKGWKPDATFSCRGVSFEDNEQFPYRLTDAAGAVRYRDQGDPTKRGQLDVNLIAHGEGRPIRVTAEFRGLPCVGDPPPPPSTRPAPPCPVGWIEINADALRVTEALIAALPSNAQRVARSLNPAGEFAAKWRMERLSVEQHKPRTTIQLTAKECTAKYDRFPYPLSGVNGVLNEQNGRWWFENVTARGAGGQLLTASGAIDPPPAGTSGPRLFRMRVGGAALPLDDALRGALPTNAKQAWTEVRPRGRINFTADVFCRGSEEPRIHLVMAPHQRDLSIDPKSFPYRLEGIDGRFVFADRRLTFESARSHHGRTQIEGDGAWTPTGNGGWRLDLTSIAVDRLDADHDFRLAAPIDLRRVLSKVDAQGSFGVHNGRLAIIKPDDPAAPVGAEWDMEIDFHQADLNGGLRIEDAAGSVRLAGRSAGGKAATIGELRIDTLFWNGLQLTNVRGPLWADNNQCLLGAAVTSQQATTSQPTPPRRVTGELYGGAASLNAQVIFDEQPRYGAAVAFSSIDLERFTAEYGHAKAPVSGRMDGSLELQGLGTTVYGVGGSGEVHIREGDFGELPVLVSLLKVLRSRAPDKTAFDRCDARFNLQGEHINFEQLDLRGDAINLYGVGEARVDRSLDVAFRTIVGRGEVSVPVLRSLMGQASEQLLTIRVGGTVDEPQIRRETLPVVGNVLRQLQQEQPGAPGEAPPTTPARRY